MAQQARTAHRTESFNRWVSAACQALNEILDGEDYLNESGGDWRDAEEAYLLVRRASQIFETLKV